VRPSPSFLLVCVAAVVATLLSLAPPATAAEPTSLALTATGGTAGAPSTVTAQLLRADGSGVAGAPVLLERSYAGTWVALATVTTDASGRAVASAPLARTSADNTFRASYAGDATYAPAASAVATAPLTPVGSRLRLRAPRTVVDERSVTLRVRWTTQDGAPVSGEVRFEQRVGQRWQTAQVATTDATGRARAEVEPRTDSRWRVRAEALEWVGGTTSRVRHIDNLPPGEPVRLPAGAPRPRISLPDQPRAVGEGPGAVVTPIPDDVWDEMTGVSWHPGCPVGREGLRLLRINYWDYDGYRRRGELVAATGAVERMRGALSDMYRARLPIRSMWRVDRFGWSGRVRGGDDYASMAAGNTSAFNCRDVVGRPGVRSPHAWGGSLDVNTWENPFRSARGIVPNAWWQPRSHPRVAWRSRSHPVVRTMTRHGLRWAYGLSDTQHFETSYRPERAAYPRCAVLACD